MRTSIAIAALGIALTTSGCHIFGQKAKERDLPPRQETSSQDSIPADVENVPDAVPRSEPLSQYGNPESYTVYGETYQVLPSARGYREKGYASWYGRKFHGRRTSSGEIYDMYQMTAAHRTLPLPSFVKVRNVENGREITVRVNDRGPFHSDRIIDLSYAAAAKLGILDAGSAMVEVAAVDTGSVIAQSGTQGSPQAVPQQPTYQQPNYQTPAPAVPQQQPPYGNNPVPTTQNPYADTNPYASNPAQQTQAPSTASVYPQGPSTTGSSIDLNAPSATPVPVPATPAPPVVTAPPASPIPPVASSPSAQSNVPSGGYNTPSTGSIYDSPPATIGEPEPASIYDTPASIYDTPDTSYDANGLPTTEPATPVYNTPSTGSPYADPQPQPTATAYAPATSMVPGTYLQAGAYGQSSNAYAMAERLRNAGFNNVVVSSANGDGLSRVHVGPYPNGPAMDADKRRLNILGINAFTVRR